MLQKIKIKYPSVAIALTVVQKLGTIKYMKKTAELAARLRALVRRPALNDEKIICYSDLYYNLEDRTLNELPLSEKEAGIIEALLKNPEHVLNKEYLLSHVWGSDASGEDNYVEVYISYLRKKLEKLKSKAKIKTIRGLG